MSPGDPTPPDGRVDAGTPTGGGVDDVAAVLDGAGLTVLRGEPLGPSTTLGVGGPAAVLVEPADAAALRVVMQALGDAPDVPLLVIGRGSNSLVSDDGWPGLVVQLGEGFRWHEVEGTEVRAGAATAMPALAVATARAGLAGLEWGAGVPGSLGGAVRMNAGAHGGDTAEVLVEATVVLPGGEERVLGLEDLGFGYRRSTLPERSVVTAARFRLRPDEPAAVKARCDEIKAWRKQAQPLTERNCGSVFTNPPGDSAGRLVEAAGLKGRRRGGARISEKHANFIVVEPGTRAVDVLALIDDVQRAVAAAGGPELHPEVRLVGAFPPLGAASPAEAAGAASPAPASAGSAADPVAAPAPGTGPA